MARRVQIRLNPESVQSAINEIQALKASVQRLVNEFVEEMVAYGVERVKYHIVTARPSAAVEDWELYDSVEGIYNAGTGKGIIRVNSQYAIYVERGTGIYSPSGSNHGEEGWWYYDKGRNGGGRRRWTQGEPPRPFMFQTYMDLCEKAQSEMRTRLRYD